MDNNAQCFTMCCVMYVTSYLAGFVYTLDFRCSSLKMVIHRKTPDHLKVTGRVQHQHFGKSITDIHKNHPTYARSTIYWQAKLPLDHETHVIQAGPGRPRLLSEKDWRRMSVAVDRLRRAVGNHFTARALQYESNLQHISKSTFKREINRRGYTMEILRKKGILTEKDKKIRLKYARTMKKTHEPSFWRDIIMFYCDGVSFYHKTNPCLYAKQSATRGFVLKDEKLKVTARGSKEGSGGRAAHFFVGISYSKGIVLCFEYPHKVNGKMFAQLVKKHFPKFRGDPCDHLFVQDGDPVQNSAAARSAFESQGLSIHHIPARSPDLNPIENIFHVVRNNLREQAVKQNICKETYSQFVERVKQTLLATDIELIQKTIATLPNRLDGIIDGKGDRTKY